MTSILEGLYFEFLKQSRIRGRGIDIYLKLVPVDSSYWVITFT